MCACLRLYVHFVVYVCVVCLGMIVHIVCCRRICLCLSCGFFCFVSVCVFVNDYVILYVCTLCV